MSFLAGYWRESFVTLGVMFLRTNTWISNPLEGLLYQDFEHATGTMSRGTIPVTPNSQDCCIPEPFP